MTICLDMEELMSLKLDNLITEAQRQTLEAHLATCAHCAATWEAMQRASALLWSSPMVNAPAGFVENVLAGVERRERARRLWVRGLLLGGVALVALLGVAGMAALIASGSLWGPLQALYAGLGILFRQTGRLAGAAAEAMAILVRLLGPSAVMISLCVICCVAASSVGLWLWVWQRLSHYSSSAPPATANV